MKKFEEFENQITKWYLKKPFYFRLISDAILTVGLILIAIYLENLGGNDKGTLPINARTAIVLMFIVALIGALFKTADRPDRKINNLEDQIKELNNKNKNVETQKISETCRRLLKQYIKDIANKFYKPKKLDHPPSTMRISVYTGYGSKVGSTDVRVIDRIVQIARYSSNEAYNTEFNKSDLQMSKSGVVGKAWDDPDGCDAPIKADPNTDIKAYENELVGEWGMDRAHAESLSMKSRHLRAQRLNGVVGNDPKTTIGIILIETTEESLDQNAIDLFDILSNKNSSKISDIIIAKEESIEQNQKDLLYFLSQDPCKIVNDITADEYALYNKHSRGS